MLEVLRDRREKELKEPYEYKDIIIKRKSYQTTYEDGKEIRTPKIEKVNITKKVNEVAKVVKQNNAIEKIEELERLYTKEVL